MIAKELHVPAARRSFLARLGAGIGLAGASVIGARAAAAQAGPGEAWRPARHAQDDWLDKIPGVHRMLFDATSAENMGLALLFGANFFSTNRGAYDLQQSDLAVLIVARHKGTSFAYNDAMWAKYGKQLSEHSEFSDPKTKQPPTVNVYNAPGDILGAGLMSVMIHNGAQFAVCSVSTGSIARKIAQATGANPENITKEIAANLVGNARMVPAGIVAVNRAQERGYTLS